jgi:hypothetical protein
MIHRMAMTVAVTREIISNFLLVFFVWFWFDSSEAGEVLRGVKPKQ